MTDVLSCAQRKKCMSNVRDKNTKPEVFVRSLLHQMGFRFRLHRKDLPGLPDIVLPKYRTVMFVHGCFWHRHLNCRRTTMPATNSEFWQRKFDENMRRDRKTVLALTNLGWNIIIVWECETQKRNRDALQTRLANVLKGCVE